MFACSNPDPREDGPAPDPVVPPGTCDPGPPPTLAEAFAARGFTVQAGRAAFVQDVLEQCCDVGTCLGNNPSSPYGLWYLPPGPGQTAVDPLPGADGLSSIWHIGPNEAVIWLGSTPPEAAYAGWTTYLMTRPDASGEGQLVIASMDDPINQLGVRTDGPVAGGLAAIITTGDVAIERLAREALDAAGVSEAAVNLAPIPPQYAHLGLDPSADTFSVLHRVAVWTDSVAGAAYVEQPANGTLLRVTLTDPPPPEPQPVPALTPNGTGTTEAALLPSVQALEDAIVAAYPLASEVVRLGPAQPLYPETFICIEEEGFCDDQRDRLQSSLPGFELGERDLVYAFGVNHAATGKASYSNLSVVGRLWFIGIEAIDDRMFPGSAADYLPDDPAVDQLYAWRVARSCAGLDRCVEVPYTCPGAPPGTDVAVTFRAYLEPATATAPLASELVLDRIVILRDVM